MRYYTVPRVGSGTAADSYRPAISPGYCAHIGAVTCLVAVPDSVTLSGVGITALSTVSLLRAECDLRGLSYQVVLSWRA